MWIIPKTLSAFVPDTEGLNLELDEQAWILERSVTASGKPGESQARDGRQGLGGGSEETRWPARPGEQQYEWELPRTIVTRLGGKPYGSPYRNKRLALLGNGVVPQTAELAWRTLWKELNER